MFRSEYVSGGFPIDNTRPVLCVSRSGEARLAYNRTELRKNYDLDPEMKCYGVWAGNRNTDIFHIDPKAYTAVMPPEKNADIDSAECILVYLAVDGAFERLEYKPGRHAKDRTPVMSREQAFYDYVKKSGLRYATEQKIDPVVINLRPIT